MDHIARSGLCVYEWRCNVGDYEWLGWVDEHYGAPDEPFAKSRPFGSSWRGRKLIRKKKRTIAEKPLSDTPNCLSDMRLLSKRGLDVLGDLIAPSCEVLALDCDFGEFVAINCLLKTDCLDLNKSRYDRFSNGAVRDIRDWVFDPHRLPEAHVFRIPESCTNILVSQAFVDRVRSEQLLGFRLNLLWSPRTGPIEQQSYIRGTYVDNTEPWEKKEIRRLKSIMRQKRQQDRQKNKRPDDKP